MLLTKRQKTGDQFLVLQKLRWIEKIMKNGFVSNSLPFHCIKIIITVSASKALMLLWLSVKLPGRIKVLLLMAKNGLEVTWIPGVIISVISAWRLRSNSGHK